MRKFMCVSSGLKPATSYHMNGQKTQVTNNFPKVKFNTNLLLQHHGLRLFTSYLVLGRIGNTTSHETYVKFYTDFFSKRASSTKT